MVIVCMIGEGRGEGAMGCGLEHCRWREIANCHGAVMEQQFLRLFFGKSFVKCKQLRKSEYTV